ncbi:MAG: hypothetical protein O3C10_10205 [Chloroflexi bacterium]|nr:hypothetical protein [Chloroflexota bacterium]
MTVEEQLQQAPADEFGGANTRAEPRIVIDGFRLGEHEEIVKMLDIDGSDRFVLTDRRVIYVGGDEDHRNWAFAPVSEVTTVELSRAPRERTTLIWGVLGLVAAVGMWQVATNDTVGIIGGLVMAVLAVVLLWDYYLRTPPSQLVFRAGGKDIGGPLTRSAEAGAREFGDSVFELKSREAVPARPAGITRRYRYPAP